MLCGMNLEKEIDTGGLAVSVESGWFMSSRQNDLVKIGKIAGYFLRKFAYSIYEALHGESEVAEKTINDVKFNDCVNSLKLNKAVVPVIARLEISANSSFNTERFTCLDESLVRHLSSGDELDATLRAKLIIIKEEYHDCAWRLLNMRTSTERVQALNDLVMLPVTSFSNEVVSALNTAHLSLETEVTENKNGPNQKRAASTR